MYERERWHTMGSLSMTGTLKVASWEDIFGKDEERKAGRRVIDWGVVR